jgi:hypothetical protein
MSGSVFDTTATAGGEKLGKMESKTPRPHTSADFIDFLANCPAAGGVDRRLWMTMLPIFMLNSRR